MELFIFLFIWMLVDNVLNIISKTYRRETIRMLIEHDKEMKNYWKDFWEDIKKLFRLTK